MSSATMALKDRVLLLPAIADRGALLWSKRGIESKDFEIHFTLSGQMPKDSSSQDGALAFWLSLEDFAGSFDEKTLLEKVVKNKQKDWKIGFDEAGLTFLSNKPDFKGLAVIFVPAGVQSQKQSIAALWNDGSRKISSNVAEVLKEPKIKIATSDWLHFGMQVKIRVKEDGSISLSKRDLEPGYGPGSKWSWAPNGEDVEGEFTLLPDHTVVWKDEKPSGRWDFLRGGKMNVTIKGSAYTFRLDGNHAHQELPESPTRGVAFYGSKDSEEAPWQQFASFPANTLPVPVPKTYIGFSGFSGTKTGMEVELNTLETASYDEGTRSYQAVNDLSISNPQAWMKVLEDEARYIDKASQSEAIARLTKLLSEQVMEDVLQEDQLRASLVEMEGRIESLSKDFGGYLAATQAWSPLSEKLDPNVVREHLGKVSTLLSQGKEVHGAKMNEIQSAASQLKDVRGNFLGEAGKKKVQEVASQAKQVQDYASAGSSQSTVSLVIIVIAVAGLGFLFFNRMRYYEKRHFI